LQRGYKEAYNG
jgi:pimeloyl-ACP methyl ester carboxylesterase